MVSPRHIIVYRDPLLTSSETFVRDQAESLTSFRPIYVGLRSRGGLSLPESRVQILCSSGVIGSCARVFFKLLGPLPYQVHALSKYAPTLLHAHFAPNACDAMSLARILGIPMLVSLHGYDVNSDDAHLPRLYLWRRKRMMSYGSRFLCVSEFIRQQALKKGFPAEKLLLHYTGVDTNFFAPDRAIARAPVVLFVGRLNPAKGLEYLIHAMASIQRVIPIAKLVVIGEGPQRSELEGLAGANIDNFIFLGVQPPAVVKYWMNRAKVFSSPCYVTSTDQEGFGMTFAEAQAMGLPVVSCSIGGIPEAVAHDQSGFLVPQRDWEALVPKLLLLLQNQDLWNTFSEAGMARVQKLFNIRTQATRLERTYESVLTGWNSRPYETS